MRLQVFLAHAGVCSRRKALILIQSGKITVDHQVVLEPSCPVQSGADKVFFNGKQVHVLKKIYVVLNKPKGVVTTVKDRFAEKTVCDLLPKNLKHLYPAGRLDKETTGLLLLSNDGDVTQHLLHPSFEVQKTYAAILDRDISEEDRIRLERGVLLDDKKTAPCRIKKTGLCRVEITIHEGRKRQIRRMFALRRYHVKDLARIKQGSLVLGDLKEGQWRFLTKGEELELKKELKIDL